MGRLLVLALLIVLASTLTAATFHLTAKIEAGATRIAAGQVQVTSGQAALNAGKARLQAGKSTLAEGKKTYAKAHDNPFLVVADAVLHGGSTFSKARDRIAEGNREVKAGQNQLDAKTLQLEQGKRRLAQGKQLMRWARIARIAGGSGAMALFAAAVILGFLWRRSLLRTLAQARRRKGTV